MPKSEGKEPNRNEETGVSNSKALSRREFLRVAGLSGATIALGAGLGGVLAACGGEETTTTGAGATTTMADETTTTVGGTTSSVSAGAETGRELKVGFVSPVTGPIALFGVPDQYCATRWSEAVSDGLVCGDGKNHPISIVVRDSQSDSNRAAQVGGDLITNDKVDVIMAASTNDTVTPVAAQAEALQCPMFSNDAPWQAYYLSQESSAGRFPLDLARVLGSRGRHRDIHEHVGRHADQQEGRRHVA